jgi:uncharacterized protein (TIGR03083 family)
MEISQHIAAIERDAMLMADAARRAGPDAAVPSCAPWQVRDLLTHQGYVHRWATGYVGEQHRERVPRLSEPELLAAGPADADLLDWFRAGYEGLTATLRAADTDLHCWAFLPAPSPLAFWARRQAHETAIHRADAQLAAGAVTPFPADFAADGIDELIMGFFGRGLADPPDQLRTLRVVAADAGASWLVTLTPDGTQVVAVERGAADARADTKITGPASDVYLLLWNRSSAAAGGVGVAGDPGLVKSWSEAMHVRWS